MDALSTALAQRRGKSIDPSMLITQEHSGDVRDGLKAPNVIQQPGMSPELGKGPVEDGIHKGAMASPIMDPHAEHLDEHIQGAGEAGRGHPQPLSQSPAQGLGELDQQMMQEIAGHGSSEEYQALKGIKPRSLGERAKMAVMQKQYGDKD